MVPGNALSFSDTDGGQLTDQLYGPITMELGNCCSLQIFTAANNDVKGSIPVELGHLQSVASFLVWLWLVRN
uniref:Uncharacterized protein n=1 Tax=Cannabis sativa TaxID=3483 RepID=A0A803NWX3_CANSA